MRNNAYRREVRMTEHVPGRREFLKKMTAFGRNRREADLRSLGSLRHQGQRSGAPAHGCRPDVDGSHLSTGGRRLVSHDPRSGAASGRNYISEKETASLIELNESIAKMLRRWQGTLTTGR
jgi:hypothetical protein